MKKIILFLPFVVFAFFACEKDELEKMVTFNFYDYETIVIQSKLGINSPVSIITPDIKSSSRTQFENNNTNADLVKNVKLTSLQLDMKEPDNADFDLLKSIQIYILADGLEKKLVAFKNDIPTDVGKSLSLDIVEDNLDDYIKKDSYSLETVVVTRKEYLSDLHIQASMAFSVTADVF